MGWYYNPPAPFIGGAQPLAPRELVPQAPAPVLAGPSLLPALVAAWTAAAPLPQLAAKATPPSAPIAAPILAAPNIAPILTSWSSTAPAAQRAAMIAPLLPPPVPPLPSRLAQLNQATILASWGPALPPAQSGVAIAPLLPVIAPPSGPPARQGTTPTEILIGWLPAPPAFQRGAIGVPLLPAPPIVSAPPLRQWSVPTEVLLVWLPPAPPPQLGGKAVPASPITPPPPKTLHVLAAVIATWPWDYRLPILPKPPLLPSGPAPSQPPPTSTVRMNAVIASWPIGYRLPLLPVLLPAPSAPLPPPPVVPSHGDPNYDLIAVIDLYAPGIVLNQALLDAVAAAYVANGYEPLTEQQVLTIVQAVNGGLPSYPTGLPRFPDSNPASFDDWVQYGPWIYWNGNGR